LIHSNAKDEELQERYGFAPIAFTKIMDDVFAQKPNRKNLEEFFKNEVMQDLWWERPHA